MSVSMPSEVKVRQARSGMLAPALLTTTSNRPRLALIASAIFLTSPFLLRSAGSTRALPAVVALIRCATASRGPVRRPLRTTVIPSSASAIAPASPMPVPAPVTHATLPVSFCMPLAPCRYPSRSSAAQAVCDSRTALNTWGHGLDGKQGADLGHRLKVTLVLTGKAQHEMLGSRLGIGPEPVGQALGWSRIAGLSRPNFGGRSAVVLGQIGIKARLRALGVSVDGHG